MSNIAYPRRKDTIMYETFDGTLESMQRISNVTQSSISFTVNPNPDFREGDTVHIDQVDVGYLKVDTDDYVIVKHDAEPGDFDVISVWEFCELYSKDGS